MVEKVRGKFFVMSALKTAGQNVPSEGTHITLGAVSASNKENAENCMYHRYTPSAKVEMYINNPEAEAFFTLGKTLYVDFTEAPK